MSTLKQGDLFSERKPEPKPTLEAPAWRRIETVSKPTVLSVSQLTGQVKNLLEPALARVLVRGEVSNFRGVNARGHLYFALKDERSAIDVKVWATTAAKLKFQVREGMSVIIEGSLNVYEPQGRYSLIVSRIEPEGVGAQALALEQLKQRLAAEGLIGEQRKRPRRALPFLPRRIGVVTSVSGAALRDFLKVLHRRHPRLSVLVADARMQGEGAAHEVRRALKWLSRANVDVIVVTRGGGSVDDLGTFNLEVVARAVWDCPVPVVSAVGHEIDTTLCDLVADVRAPTPSAAAELLAPSLIELEANLAVFRSRLLKAVERIILASSARLKREQSRLGDPLRLLSQQRLHLATMADRLNKVQRRRQRVGHEALSTLTRRLQAARPQAQLLARKVEVDRLKKLLRDRVPQLLSRERQRLTQVQVRLARASPHAAVAQAQQSLLRLGERTEDTMSEQLRRHREQLGKLAAQLDALSPLAVLARGYALVQTREGQVVRRAVEVQPGASLLVRLAEGTLAVDVTQVKTGSK